MEYLTYLYNFEVFLERLEISRCKAKVLSIVWKKGKKLVETEKYSGLSRGILTIQQSLHLPLKLYKNPQTHEYIPKFVPSFFQAQSTFMVCEHEGDRRRTIMEAKFNMLEMLVSPSKDFAVVFPHGQYSGKLIFRGRHQHIMELNQFRFNTQELEESDESPQIDRDYSDDDQTGAAYSEQQVVALRKEIEDLNYLNGKLKNDRQKLMLRIREVEFQFKEKQKLVLREIRHAKGYFQKKIKIRQNIYEEEIQRIVLEANEEQATFARVQEQLRDEIKQLRAKLSKSQSDLLALRDQNNKLRFEIEDRTEELRNAANEKQQQQKRVNEIISRLESEITRCKSELGKVIGEMTNEKELTSKELGGQLQNLSKKMAAQVQKKMTALQQKDKKIEQLIDDIDKRDKRIESLASTLNNVNDLLSKNFRPTTQKVKSPNSPVNIQSKLAQALEAKVQRAMTDVQSKISIVMRNLEDKLALLLAEKKTLQEELNSTEQDLSNHKKQLREAITKVELLQLDLNDKIDENRRNNDSFRMKQENLHTDLDQLREAFNLKQQQVYQMKERQRYLEGQKESLELDIKNLNELRNLDSDRLTRAEQQAAEIRHQLELKQHEIEARSVEWELKEDRLAKIQNQKHLVELQNEDLNEQIEKLKRNIKQTEQIYENKILTLNNQINSFEQAARKDQRDITIQNLYEQIKIKENQLLKINKKNKDLTETVNRLMKKDVQSSIDKEIVAHLLQLSHEVEDEGGQGDIMGTLKRQNATLLKQNLQLRKEIQSHQKMLKDFEKDRKELRVTLDRVDVLKQSTDKFKHESLEMMKQSLFQKQKELVMKDKEIVKMQQEVEDRMADLQLQVQKQQIDIEEKDQKIKALTTKLKHSNNVLDMDDSMTDHREGEKIHKYKQMIKELNNERTQHLREIEKLRNLVQEIKRHSPPTSVQMITTPNKGHMGESAKGNFSFMPAVSSPKGFGSDSQLKDRVRQLENKLMESEAEKHRLLQMLQATQKQISIIKEGGEGDPSDESFNMLNDNKKRRNLQIQTPKSSQYPLSHAASGNLHSVNVEVDRNSRQREEMLQKHKNQLEEELQKIHKQHQQLQSQLSVYKEKQIQWKYLEKQIKIKEQALSMEKDKKRQLQNRLNEQSNNRHIRTSQLQEQLRTLNNQNSNNVRQIQKWRVGNESKERQLVELRRAKQDLLREIKDMKEQQIREAKRQYEDPAEVRLREMTKEMAKLRQLEYDLRNQLERHNEQRKQRYVKLSEHKELKSDLQRTLKDKSSEIQSLQRQLQEANQIKSKSEYTLRSAETELEDLRRRLVKAQDENKTVLEDREADIKHLKKKAAGYERQQEEYDAKIQQLQQRYKQNNLDHQKTLDEVNKKAMQQLRESLTLKQQNQILAEEVKSWKKRHAELAKTVSELQDKISGGSRQQDEMKRNVQRMVKQLEEKHEQMLKSQMQSRRQSDQARRCHSLHNDSEREKKELQQQIQKLQKTINLQESDIKRLVKDVERARKEVAQTQSDQFSSNKNVKLQMQKQQETRRKLQKLLEQRDYEIKAYEYRLHKMEQEKKDALESLNELYTEKLSVYVNQIENIKKTIKQYQQQISYLKSQNRQSNEEMEKMRYRVNSLDTELKLCTEALQARMSQLHVKREECDRAKQEKYELQLHHNKLTTQLAMLIQDNKKLAEKVGRLSDQNRITVEDNQKMELQIRTLKGNQGKLQHDLNSLRNSHQRCRELETMIRKMQAQREDLIEDVRHKTQLIYTQNDFQKYQEQLRNTLAKDKELEVQQAIQLCRQDAQQSHKKLELEMIELLNEATRLRSDLERAKEHNATLLGENIKMLEYERQSTENSRKAAELEATLKERQRGWSELKNIHDKSLKDVSQQISILERQLQVARADKSEMQKQLFRGRKNQQEEAESLKKNEEKELEALQKMNEENRNRLFQMEFQNARFRQNEMALQSAYEARLAEYERREAEKMRSVDQRYAESIHRYEGEMEKMRAMVDQMKYVLEDKNHQINFRREQIDYCQQEIGRLNDEMNRQKTKINEEKEMFSLEIFKLTSRLKQNDEQWGLKVKRLEDEVNRLTNQLIQTSSRVERQMTLSKLKILDPEEKVTRKYEEKLKLKQKTIQELKQQIMSLEEKLFREEQDRVMKIPNLQPLRAENDRLRVEIAQISKNLTDNQKLQQQIAMLTDSIQSYKKQSTKIKKSEQQLQQKMDQMSLQLNSLQSQNSFLKGYENSYKQLKIQFQRVNLELRTSKAQTHTHCDVNREQLQRQKSQLQEMLKETNVKNSNLSTQLSTERHTIKQLVKKYENKEIQSETAVKIRESISQYREEINRREIILMQEMQVLKERNNTLQEKNKKIQNEKEELSRKITVLNNSISELNQENIRCSQEIFRLNSNIMKEQFTQDDERDGLQSKWQHLEHLTLTTLSLRLENAIPVLIDNHRQSKQLVDEIQEQRESYETRLYQMAQQIAQLQSKVQIRQEEFRFERERDALDIQELNKENDRLQNRISELELDIQGRENLEMQFERIEYEYNNCRIMLDICRAELEELRASLQVDSQNYVQRDQVVQNLEEILQKVHMR